MTATEILNRVKNAESDKKAIRARIRRYKESATRITAALENAGIHCNGQPDKMAEIVAEIDALERELKERDRRYAAEVTACCMLIDRLDELDGRIIYAYYIMGLTLDGIASTFGYTLRYVKCRKKQALNQLRSLDEATLNTFFPSWYIK